MGGKILEYMYWKQGMNGNQLIPIPNEFFEKKFGIARQRKCEALKKLAEAELLVLEIKKGKTASAKLIEYKYKEDPHVRE